LISNYWFSKVPLHFAAIFFLALLSFTLFVLQDFFSLPAITIASLTAFPVLILSLYLPQFTSMFLPALYKTQQKDAELQSSELEKCRKAQLPNDTLVLIWYVLDKTSGLKSVNNSGEYAQALTQLYGVDQRSIKKSIDLFFGSSIHRAKLKGRARTEIENRFTEARSFFQQLSFKKAMVLLDELEAKCFAQTK
jgi:uncharacterized protein (DUF924 family)